MKILTTDNKAILVDGKAIKAIQSSSSTGSGSKVIPSGALFHMDNFNSLVPNANILAPSIYEGNSVITLQNLYIVGYDGYSGIIEGWNPAPNSQRMVWEFEEPKQAVTLQILMKIQRTGTAQLRHSYITVRNTDNQDRIYCFSSPSGYVQTVRAENNASSSVKEVSSDYCFHTFTLVYDGETVLYYADGSRRFRSPVSGTVVSAGISGDSYESQSIIYEILIYDRALTESEVYYSSFYNKGTLALTSI